MPPDVKVLRESWIVIGNPSVTDLEFNPLTSTSDQNRPSPYNIITLSSRKVMRIRKTINQGFVDPITLARDCKNKTVFHWKAQTLACKREGREKILRDSNFVPASRLRSPENKTNQVTVLPRKRLSYRLDALGGWFFSSIWTVTDAGDLRWSR